jgi:elongation factor 1 alpha-like protein
MSRNKISYDESDLYDDDDYYDEYDDYDENYAGKSSSKPLTTAVKQPANKQPAKNTTTAKTTTDKKITKLGDEKSEKSVPIAGKVSTVVDDMAAFGFKSDLREYASDEELDTAKDKDIKETDMSKPHISLLVAGHVDAGKSTLIGKLLSIASTKRALQSIGMHGSRGLESSTLPLAWLTDESQSERDHGVTIDIAER